MDKFLLVSGFQLFFFSDGKLNRYAMFCGIPDILRIAVFSQKHLTALN
jgi:hypothetical protein